MGGENNDAPAAAAEGVDGDMSDRELRLMMDLSLERRLGEVSSLVKKDDCPMPLSKFWDVYFVHAHDGHGDDGSLHLDEPERLDCKQSTYRSVLRWARAMDKEGSLKLKESKGKKGRTRCGGPLVMAVTRRQQAQQSNDNKGAIEPPPSTHISLTAEALESFALSEQAATEEKEDKQDNKSSCDEDTGSIAVSDATSAATTTNSIATTAYEYRPTKHLKTRQTQRNVTDREIKSVLKHAKGRDARRLHDGRRVITSDGVTIVTSGDRVLSVWREDTAKGKKSPVESAWLEGGLGGDTEHFVMEECHTGLYSYMASTLGFLFPGSNNCDGASTQSPIEEAEVHSACEQYCQDMKGRDSNGGLQVIAFLNCLKQNGSNLNESDHARRVLFYSKILRSLHEELQKGSAHTVTTKETLKQLHAYRSPKFWNTMEPVFRKSPHLKDQIKAYISRGANPWPSDQMLELLLKRDIDLFNPLTADDLIEQVWNLAEPCHIMDTEEVKEGYPPYVTLAIFYPITKHKGERHKKKMDVWIVGLSQTKVDLASSRIRKAVGCSCSVDSFKGGSWTNKFRGVTNKPKPFAKEGSPMIALKLCSKNETLVKISGVLKEFAPLQYRRLVVKDVRQNFKSRGNKGLDFRVPQLLPILEGKDRREEIDPDSYPLSDT